MRKTADLLITGGTVLTVDAQDRVLEDAGVAISDGSIVAVDRTAVLSRQFHSDTTIPVPGHVVMPGLIDAYSHAGHGLIRGLFHPEHGWPAHEFYWHGTTPAWWAAEARLAAVERVRFGVTTAMAVIGATPPRLDRPEFCASVAQGYAEVGLRARRSESEETRHRVALAPIVSLRVYLFLTAVRRGRGAQTRSGWESRS